MSEDNITGKSTVAMIVKTFVFCLPAVSSLSWLWWRKRNKQTKKKEINKPKSNLAKKNDTIIFTEREYRYYKLLKHKLTENRGKATHGSTGSLQVYTYCGCMWTTCEVQRLHTEEKLDLERITVGLREGLKVCISFLPPWDSLRGRYSISAVHRSAVTLSCPALTGNF